VPIWATLTDGNNITCTEGANSIAIAVTGTTEHSIQIGSAAGSLTSIGVGTTGQILQANTTADPTWSTATYPSTTTKGDLLSASADNVIGVVTAGTTGQVLQAVTTDKPAYSTTTYPSTSTKGDIISATANNTFGVIAAGTTGQILQAVTADKPAYSTATYPSTAAIGDVLVASAANTIGVVSGATTAGYLLTSNGAGSAPTFQAATISDISNMLYVGKYGNDGNDGKAPAKAKLTIQAAVTAATAGTTIIVYPGTYTETITHAANNVNVIAEGKPSNCIITQADANVINFSSYTGIQYKYFGISCTAATTAIWTITGSTGSCTFKECQLYMTTAANIAAVDQPGIGRITGAGTLTIILGKAYYYHTGNGGATALKAAFETANGGLLDLKYIDDLTITNSGTALVSSVGIDLASTGSFHVNDCHITITDPNATIVVGLGYLGGTGTDHEFYRNELHINVTNNIGYGFYAADTATVTRFFYNHIHVTDVAGSSYSYYIGAGSTAIATFDDCIASDGYIVDAAGFFYEVNKPIRGDLRLSGPTASGTRNLTVANTDNTATVSNSAVNISVGGATSTGDPYTNYLVTGAGTF